MLGAAILWVGLGAVGAGDYLKPFGEKALDQATLDAEGFGDKKSLKREADGLRVTIKPGEAEAGWKTPQALRIGGDCTIKAVLEVRKLPKPALEDGAAIGIAVATQTVDQPELTLLREIELDGKEVYRPIHKDAGGGNFSMMPQRFNPFGGMEPAKPAKPERHLFPAKGPTLRFELRRQGQILHYEVFDEMATEPREIGQISLGPADIAGVKLFISNRNGADAVDVLFRDLTIHAERLTGLGTAVRTVRGSVVFGDPTALEGETLIVGGPPPAPTPASPPPGGGAPAPAPGSRPGPMPAPAPPAAPPGAAVTITPVAPAAPAAPAAAPTVSPAPAQSAVASAKPADAKPVGDKPAGDKGKPMPAPPPAPEPKARLPLDEVESIAFDRAASPSARFLGQPNVDATGPGGEAAKADAKDEKKGAGEDLSTPPPGTVAPVKMPKIEPKPNGIRDVHVMLSGLREAPLQQIQIQGQTDKGQVMWQLDTTGSQAWPISLQRAGNEWWADLFLEPPAGDLHNKPLQITLTYADNQNAQFQAQATAHTDPKLAFDPKSPSPVLDARVYLAGDEQLYGKLQALDEESLSLAAPWGDTIKVPMARVVGVYMGMPDHKETPASFAKRLKARGTEDLLLARAKDGEVVAIGGVVDGVKDGQLSFVYREKARTLPLKGVEGFVLARRPEPKPPAGVRPTFSLAGGIVLSGRWIKIEAESWRIEAPWGEEIKLPAADLRSVRFRGGQMTYLSDLEPSEVEQTPYFGRRSPYRKDVNFEGAPLAIDGQVFDKGLAVHSRTALTYDLDRRYATFEAVVGFDEAGKKKGRVDCRVLADGKELYANPDLRADGPPVRLSLDVSGAERLRLIVDFGPDEDTGDRLIWGDARVYRRPTPGPSAASTIDPSPKK